MPNHDISLQAASEKTANFRNAHANLEKVFTLNKQALVQILSQEGCEELRWYLSVENTEQPNKINMVLVGVDSSGNDMTSGVLKNSTFGCPPNCSEANELNGL